MITQQSPVIEYESHRFCTDASDLGWRAGQWPERVETSLGNGQPFIRVSKKLDREGDLEYVRYEQSLGCIDLKVYND